MVAKKNDRKIKQAEILRISPEMNILEAVELFPEIAEFFAERGLPCLGCAASRFEKLSDIAGEFGMETDQMIQEMEKKIKSNKK